MKIKMLEKKGDVCKFLLEDSAPAFANALRRIMISEVPTMAMDVINFQDNGSAVFDEVIANRVGNIPLRFDPGKFNRSEECKCEGKGCPLCQVVFSAEKEGPGILHSGDMKSSDKNVKPISDDFPIVQLLRGHRIKFEAVARLGTGRAHAKWQAANAVYVFYPELDVKKGFTELNNVVEACPKGVLAVRNRKLEIEDPFRADECKMAEDVSEGNVVIKNDETKFLFRVETVSGLDTKYIITEAARILYEKAKEFKADLKNI